MKVSKGKTKSIDKMWIMLVMFLTSIVIFQSINYFRYDIMRIFNFSYRKMYNIQYTDEELKETLKELKIVEPKYNWSGNLNYTNVPKVLVYHHTAISEMSAEQIDKFHKEKGWDGIGYNFYIRKDGVIYRGRPENAEGAHTIGKNTTSLGICLEGNFEEEKPTKEQNLSLERLSTYLAIKYDIKDIIGHRDVYETLCPGKNFNIEEEKKRVINNLENISKIKS